MQGGGGRMANNEGLHSIHVSILGKHGVQGNGKSYGIAHCYVPVAICRNSIENVMYINLLFHKVMYSKAIHTGSQQ